MILRSKILPRLARGWVAGLVLVLGLSLATEAQTNTNKSSLSIPARPPADMALPGGAGAMLLSQTTSNDPFLVLRRRMVSEQIRPRGIRQSSVLEAMEVVPRHLFLPQESLRQAYDDKPVAIGFGQVAYQPYMVARMTELLELKGGEKVLEIGTGSGYHSAVLAHIADEVFSVEINPDLARGARRVLRNLNVRNVIVRVGDGYEGWEEKGPFDAIILTAAPPNIPPPLIQQLKVGGRMVIPLGGALQNLQVLTKTGEGEVDIRTVEPVRLPQMERQAEGS